MTTKVRWTLVFVIAVLNLGTAQTVRVGIGGAVVALKGATVYSKTYDDQGYGFGTTAFSFIGTTKVLTPWHGLNINLGFSYIPLSASGWAHFMVDEFGSPIEHYAIFHSRAKLIAASLGPEWYLLKGTIGPHIGVLMRLVHMTPVSSDISVGPLALPAQRDGWTRFGIGITGGVEVAESSPISVDIRGHYNFDWLFQQGDGEPGLDEYGLEATVLFSIL